MEGVGSTSASIFHNHQDHLGSTAAVTSDIGYLTRLYNYYPYGTLRLDEGSTTTSFTQSNQFLGQNRDTEADLSYLNARYYSSNNGQFTSQDPVFWSTNQNLANPQSLNSYSYAEGNPVNRKDPDGLAAKDAATQAQIKSLQNQVFGLMKQQLQQMADDFNRGGKTGLSNPKEGAKSVRNSSKSKSERVGAAYGTAVSSGAIVAGMIYAPVPTAGALVGVAQRSADDKRNNRKSTGRQYAGSALFGAGTAYVTLSTKLPLTILAAAGASVLESSTLDGSVTSSNVATDVAASVAGRYTGNMVSTPYVSEALSGITEYAAYKTISDYLAN